MTTRIENRPIAKDKYGVMYVMRGYKPWMTGRQIPDDYVVRPQNHKWFGEFGGKDFTPWSTGWCPTYGTCNNCYAGGLVRMTCVNPICKQTYLVMFTQGVNDFKVTLDSQWISTLVGASHTPAMADRVQAWIRTPFRQLPITHMRMVIARNARHLDTNEERKVFANTKMNEFQEGLNEEYPEQLNNVQQI